MGRKRTRNLGLPSGMYRAASGLYYVLKHGKYMPLGHDYADALRLYAQSEAYRTGKRTVGALLDAYFLEYVPTKEEPITESTLELYHHLAGMIRKEWGNHQLEDVRRGDVQRYLDIHPHKGVATNAMRFFKTVMDRARKWEYIDRNPLEDVEFPRLKARSRVLTDDEMLRIRANLLPKLRVIVDLAYLLSARVSEVSAIRWDDIRDGVLYMRRKKGKDTQPFIITPDVQALLDEAKSLGGKVVSMEYILLNERRKPFDERYVSQAFSAAARKAGIMDVRFHDVRRTSADDDQDTAQKRLGHADARTTRKHYTPTRQAVRPLERAKK